LFEILRSLGLSVEREKRAWEVATLLDRGVQVPRLKCVEVVGPFGAPKTGCPKLAVDGAANELEDYDFLLSDGDGARAEELSRASEEKLLFLVVHGDNFEKLIKIPLGNRVIPVVQSPRGNGLCVPAFSDGDKAKLLASMMADEVFVSGLEAEEGNPTKERKFELSKVMGVEGALGGYGRWALDEGERRGL